MMHTTMPTKTILILEDQALVRAGMKLLLQMAEPLSHICEAGNYDEAVAHMKVMEFDFAFVDIDLRSERTGMDILRLLRTGHASTRVVMLSGNDDRDVILDCIGAGASGYIPKATEDDAVFRKAIQTVMDDGIFLPASVLLQPSHALVSPTALLTGRSAGELGLSERLCEVLFYLCQGLPNKTIANKMGISEGTVRKNYVSALLSFFKVSRRTELMIEVSRRKIRIPPPRVRLNLQPD